MKTFKEFITEAKQEKDLTPLEKEDIRNKRSTGTITSRNSQTGTRRMFHYASRGAKYDKAARDEYRTDPGNLPDTKEAVRSRIKQLKGYRRGRMFSRMVRGDLSHPESREIKNNIEKEKSKKFIAVRNAQSNIKKFRR
jgi:hypothetical protein